MFGRSGICIKKSLNESSLVMKSQYNKISYNSNNPYNKRWEYKFKHSYYTYPRDYEHTEIRKPEDSYDVPPMYFAYYKDFIDRWVPGLNMWWERRARIFDKFNIYALPATSLFFY